MPLQNPAGFGWSIHVSSVQEAMRNQQQSIKQDNEQRLQCSDEQAAVMSFRRAQCTIGSGILVHR